jgi:hypothetical protein
MGSLLGMLTSIVEAERMTEISLLQRSRDVDREQALVDMVGCLIGGFYTKSRGSRNLERCCWEGGGGRSAAGAVLCGQRIDLSDTTLSGSCGCRHEIDRENKGFGKEL